MFKSLIRNVSLMTLLLGAVTACDDDKTLPVDNPDLTPPTMNVSVDKLTRTEVTFSVTSDDAADYAYAILPSGETVASAESLFDSGKFGLIEDGVVTVTGLDIEGGHEYTLWVAVCKVNPYVYGELRSVELNTNLPYSSLVTLDRV